MKTKSVSTVLVSSSNNHYTDEKVTVKDNVIESETEFTVKHIEHEPLTIKHKKVKIGRVQEYDPLQKLVRAVQD